MSAHHLHAVSSDPDHQELANWSADLPSAFLLCRDMGHTWHPWRAFFVPKGNFYERSLRCGRCKTVRRQHLAMNGQVLSTAYEYADGYQAPKGVGRLDTDARSVMRLTSTLRLLGEDEVD